MSNAKVHGRICKTIFSEIQTDIWKAWTGVDTIKGGTVMTAVGIILGVACAMYAGAVMDLEDVEQEMEENK